MKVLTRTLALLMLVAAFSVGPAMAGVAPGDFGDSVVNLPGYQGKVVVRDGVYAFGFVPYEGTTLEVYQTVGQMPQPLAFIPIAAQPEQLAVAGDYVYILHGQNGGSYPSLSVVYVGNPATPEIVYHESLDIGETNFQCYNGIAVAEGFLWLAIDAVPYVYDVSRPWDPVYRGQGTGFHEVQGNATDRMIIKDGFVYIASRQYISPGVTNPSLVSYRVDPADNAMNETRYVPVAESSFNYRDEELLTVISGDRPELYASVSAALSPRDGSGILRLRCNADGTVSLVAALRATDDLTYQCSTLGAEGNYLYAQAHDVMAIDISNPQAMSLVGACDDLDGFMTVYADYIAGGSKATLRINDQPQALTTGIRASNGPHPTQPGRYVWTFQWYTDTWTDPGLDMVIVTAADNSCWAPVPVFLHGHDFPLDVSCEFDLANGRFHHVFKYTVPECYLGCWFNWYGLSSRTNLFCSVQGSFKIKQCVQGLPQSGDDLASPGPILAAPAPNPFNPQTTLRFYIPAGVRMADLYVHDVSGRVVRRLKAEAGIEGWQEAVWTGVDDSGRRVPSGVYFANLVTDLGAGEVQKLMLIK